MMQKLRLIVESMDNEYRLGRIVELAEGYFESVDTEKEVDEKAKPKKRGQRSQEQRKVLVMALTIHDFSKKKQYGEPIRFRYEKMNVADNLKGQTVGKKVSGTIKYDAVVKTDNYTSYSRIKDQFWCHIPQKVIPR
jgi:hypothetical protein